MEDSYRHKGLRKKLVETIRSKGIHDEKVLKAIGKVPRHLFMDSGFLDFSYKDQAFPIAEGQTISQPYTVAFQTQLLEIAKHDKVLEIGTGSGYQAAVLAEMGARVYTVERHRELYINAQKLLSELGYEVHFFYGDGFEGMPSYGPYDKVLITAAVRDIPEKLLEQMKTGGFLVAPVGGSYSQAMTRVRKISEDEYERSAHGAFTFVPMLRGTNNKKS